MGQGDEKIEPGGILVCQNVGRRKVYSFNPRYAFLPELKALLEKAFNFYPEEVKEDLEL